MTTSTESYLLNCWYAFAWAHEVTDSLFTRSVLDRKIVAFRQEDGAPAAFLDRCPHRFAPLSMGNRVGDTIRCQYHGLGFDVSGKCVFSPYTPDIPSNGNVQTFPLTEKFGMIWIWLGDRDSADPTLVPDFSFHNTEEPGSGWPLFGYTLMPTNYQVEADNLLDLSHIETLHASSFGGRGYIPMGEFQIEDLGEEVHAKWWVPNAPMIDPVTGQRAPVDIDHFIDMRWNAPSNLALHTGFVAAEEYRDFAKSSRASLPGQWTSHILTPKSATETHYFWSACRPTDMTKDMPLEGAFELFKQAFEAEDKPMLAAVQANMEADFWEMRPMILPTDAGGIRTRRRLAKMISDERKFDKIK